MSATPHNDEQLRAELAFAAHLQQHIDSLCLERDTLRAQLIAALATLRALRSLIIAYSWTPDTPAIALIDAALAAPTDAPVRSAAGTAEPPTWARHIAAQAWCTPATSHITLDPALAEAFAAILAQDARCGSEAAALRSQLADALAALARIRNVATSAHAPPAQRLDWCANEAVLALDRSAPSAPSGTSTPT